MRVDDDLLSQFTDEVLARGPAACLPCNLSDRWLRELTRQGETFFGQAGNESAAALTGSVCCLLLHLHGGPVSERELMNRLPLYYVELALEEAHRRSPFLLERATLENILTDRKIVLV